MIYEWLVPNLFFPAYDLLTGTKVWRESLSLQKLQWLPYDELKNRASAKLNPLLKHACEQVPYYRSLFKQAGIRPGEIKSVDELSRVPITSGETLRQNHDGSMLASNLPASRRLERFSSGSSGQPKQFFVDRRSIARSRASLLFFRSLAGINPWDATLWLTSPPHLRAALEHFTPMVKLARRYLMGEVFHNQCGDDFSLADWRAFTRNLPGSRDYFIFAFPTFINRMLRQLAEYGDSGIRMPKAVLSYAHTMPAGLPEKAEHALGCCVFDMYSSIEVLFMALSCPDNPRLMHINTERAWLRVVDPQGNDCRPGQSGRVLVTDLHNYVMPLINYDLGDIASMGGVCSCGRGFPTLKGIIGRTSEYLRLPNGRIASSSTMARVLLNKHEFIPYVWEYQARQVSLDHIVYSIVPTKKFDRAIHEAMLANLQDYYGRDVKIELLVVESLPANEPGQKRPTIIPLDHDGSAYD